MARTRPFLVFALAFVVLAFPAWAEAQTVTRSNSTDGFADRSEITRDVTFPTTDFAFGAFVSDVVVTLDFAKIADNASNYTCGPPPTTDGFNEHNQELYYRLTSPEGTTISLISAGSYTAISGFGGEVVVTLSDAASSPVGGAVPTSGTFRPSQPLSTFDGEDPEGTWTLTIGDTVLADANCFYNVDIAVTVVSPTAAIDDLFESVELLGLHHGIENSLLKKLANAQMNLDADDIAGACDKLASFIAEVQAQSGKKIDADDADDLIADAEAVRESLDCD